VASSSAEFAYVPIPVSEQRPGWNRSPLTGPVGFNILRLPPSYDSTLRIREGYFRQVAALSPARRRRRC